MNLQETKNIIELANNLNIDKHELFENISEENTDFEIDSYRFITEDEALNEVVNMYKYDEYLLGCFNAGFIEDFIDLDYDSIKTIQERELFEVIGKLIINSGNIEAMMEEYICLDGYGHALNSYDGYNKEITLNNIDYIYFKN